MPCAPSLIASSMFGPRTQERLHLGNLRSCPAHVVDRSSRGNHYAWRPVADQTGLPYAVQAFVWRLDAGPPAAARRAAGTGVWVFVVLEAEVRESRAEFPDEAGKPDTRI